MPASKVPVTFAFGRRDRIDPKLAPLGVLKVGKNLRVRKDGRLGMRDGYTPISMVTANGALVAYDLHEYRGRLCASGSDTADGFPVDVFEYLGMAPNLWRGSDRFGRRVALNPFSNLREVAGIPQPNGGVTSFDAAATGGYVCLVFVPTTVGGLLAVIVDAATDQVVHFEDLTRVGGPFSSDTGKPFSPRVIGIGSTFYVAAWFGATSHVVVGSFIVGTSSVWTPFYSSGTVTGVTSLDLCPVTNPTTARLILAFDRGNQDLDVRIFNTLGTQVGATITVSGTLTNKIAIEADQTDNTINLFTVESPSNTRLRTFNFAGSLLTGPTTLTNGFNGSICRLPALGTLGESVAVAVDTSDLSAASTCNVAVTVYNQDTHAAGSTFTVYDAALRTRLFAAQSARQPAAVLFGALVAPGLPSYDQATNALFFAAPDVAHVVFRDYVSATNHALVNLSRDTSTGALCWPALFDPGVDVSMPVVSLVDIFNTERRQGVVFGGLYYEAGAALSVYDGRFPAELGFGEAPGIISATPSHSATYDVVATITGAVVGTGALQLTSRDLIFFVDDGTGSPGEVRIPFTFAMTAAVAAALIAFTASGVLTASVVSGALVVSTVATAVTLTLTSGSAAASLGFGALVGRTFYGTSALQPGATYYYTVHFETVLSDKSLMLGPPSVGGAAGDDFARAHAVTLTGNQNIVTLVVTTPHSARVAMGDAVFGGDITAVLSRTEWSPSAETAGSVFRRCVAQRVPVGIASYGALLTIIDNVSDTALGDNEALYTQASRGALSGPLEQNAPQPSRLVAATESRLITAGLGHEFLVQVSRDAFLGEAFSFSDFSQFFSQVAGPVIGVRSLDSARLVFTADRIYAVTGAGPDDVGGGGFDPPVEIPTPSGLSNAWSFLEGPDGLWFQLDDTKLFRIPRGGGAPTWEGVDVEDTLQDFPIIVGTAKHKRDNTAVFACCSAVSSDVRFLVRDFRTENWFEDTVPLGDDSPVGGHGVDAITSYGETLAYASAGTVFVQSAGDYLDGASGAFIETQARTHPLYPFGVGGYGQIYDLLLTGEYRGDCRLECRVSYDDGLAFAALTSFDLLASDGLVAGQTIQRRWAMPQDITSSLVVEFTITQGSGVESSEGFVFNQFDLLVEAEDGLRELRPDEMA